MEEFKQLILERIGTMTDRETLINLALDGLEQALAELVLEGRIAIVTDIFGETHLDVIKLLI